MVTDMVHPKSVQLWSGLFSGCPAVNEIQCQLWQQECASKGSISTSGFGFVVIPSTLLLATNVKSCVNATQSTEFEDR